MATKIPKGFEKIAERMKKDHEEILKETKKYYKIEPYPTIEKKRELDGEAIAQAHPIQGILKYHGMSDWDYRIAFLPTISLTNDAAKVITFVKFDPELKKDKGVVNGKKSVGRDLERISQTLDMIRKITGAKTKALVVSKNLVRSTKLGKGIGISAGASAALATAAVTAALGEKYYHNKRFLSSIGRLLAGSGCRSSSGGIALWFSYPGISHEDSFSVRLDDKKQLRDVSIITVPIDSSIELKTEEAHEVAPHSPFFKKWMDGRKEHILQLMRALRKKDWETIAKLGELDTMLMHGVTMSADMGKKLVSWEPETIRVIRVCNELRDSGIPCYYNIDTGPTTILMTHKKFEAEVAEKIKKLGLESIIGRIGGGAELLEEDADEALQINRYKSA